MVIPRSACRALTAINGPGCGGNSACNAVSPARAGIAIVRICFPERRAITKIIGAIRTSPTSKNSGSPITSATAAITHGRIAPRTCRSNRETIRSAAPDSASKAPNMAPKAIMMPASPSSCPAPCVKLNPSLSAGTPATSPVTNVPIRMEKNGTILNPLINPIMIARPKDTENNSCVSCAVQGATGDIRTAVNYIDNQRVNYGQH